MTEESAKSGVEGSTGRRTFLKTVGAAGTVGLLSGQATAGGVERVVGDGLSTSTGQLQEVIVVFDDTDSVDRLDRLDLARGYYAYETLPMAYTELDGDQVRELATWDSVQRVVENREIELENDDSQEDTNAREVWEDADLGYTGENVHVAIIDSGLDGKHPGLAGSVEANYQWAGDPLVTDEVAWVDVGPAETDQLGHGTHCAGSICGDGTGSVDADFAGMAPDASLTAYSFPPLVAGVGEAELDGIAIAVAAYDHIIAGKRNGDHDIQLVSNSWTWGNEFHPHDPVPRAVWEATKEGILAVFSAGNDGPGRETLNETKEPFVLSVAAADDGQAPANFTSRGVIGGNHDRQTALENVARIYEDDDVDGEADVDGPIRLERPGVAAKGHNVMSTQSAEQAFYALGAVPASTEPGEQTSQPLYGTLSGTSMACPTTVGCTALFVDAYYDEHGEYPNPIDTINAMEATSREAADGCYDRVTVGAGYVDAKAAVEAALGGGGLPPGIDEMDELPPGLQDGDLPPGLARRDSELPGFDDVELAAPAEEPDEVEPGPAEGEPADSETVETVAIDSTTLAPATGSPAVAGNGVYATQYTDWFVPEAGTFDVEEYDENRVVAELTWNETGQGPNSLNLFLQQQRPLTENGAWETIGFGASDPGPTGENRLVLEVRDRELYDGDDPGGNAVETVALIDDCQYYRFGVQSDSGAGDFRIEAELQVFTVE